MEYVSRNDEPCKISTVTLLNITLLLSAQHQPLFHNLYINSNLLDIFIFAVCYRHFAGEKKLRWTCVIKEIGIIDIYRESRRRGHNDLVHRESITYRNQ